MTALILLAHGSRHPETAPALAALARDVRDNLPASAANGPSHVEIAWLDLAEPSLEQVCANLAADGVRNAIAVPLLFTDAFHARVDIPAQVAACSHLGVSIAVTESLGLGDGTRRAVLHRIIEAAPHHGTVADVVLMGVGSSEVTANNAVHQFARHLEGLLPGRVTASFVVGSEAVKGAAAVSAAARRAALHGRKLVVVPLFTAPGLLWDKVRREASELAVFGEPLKTLLAPIVCCRWDSVALGAAA